MVKRILLVLMLCGAAPVWAAGAAQSTPQIARIAIDSGGAPLLLDTTGRVWVFSNGPSFGNELNYPIVKVPGFKHITQLAQHMALDSSGNLYIWRWANNKALPDSPVHYKLLHNVTWISPESPREDKMPDSDGEISPMSAVNYRYLVTVANRDVYEIGLDNDGKPMPPKRLYASTGIRAIADSVNYETETIVLLQTDGELIRIVDVPKDNTNVARKLHITKLGRFPDVVDVSVNIGHIVLLDKSGHVSYIGKCDAVRKGPDGRWVPIPGQKREPSAVDGVVALELHTLKNDDAAPNALLRKDGSVWADSPQSPSVYTGNRTCAEAGQSDYGLPPGQIFHGPAPVRQIAFGGAGGTYYFLDANHVLWMMEASNPMFDGKKLIAKAVKVTLNYSSAVTGPGASEVPALEKLWAKEFDTPDYATIPDHSITITDVTGKYAHGFAAPGDVYFEKEHGHWVITDWGSGAAPPDGYPE